MDLTEARDKIAAIDGEMAKLFVERMEAARDIAAYKRDHGLPIEDKEQEQRVLEERGALVEDPELHDLYLLFLQNTMDVCKLWQHKLIDDQQTD